MKLTWTSKQEWGTTSKTHRAKLDGFSFCIDRPRKNGGWVLRGWKDGEHFVYREATTLKALKAVAQGLADKDGAQL